MRTGLCCGEDRFALAASYGVKYAEPAINRLREYDTAALRRVKELADSAGMPIEGFNCFFGGGISLYRDSIESVISYCETNFRVAGFLGASYCVIGAGSARSVPSDVERARGEERFMLICDKMATSAAEHGISIYIEPLNRSETNLINTLPEGLAFCRALGNKNVGCLLDFYHFYREGEDLAELDDVRKGELRHIHIARPNRDRRAPRREDAGVLTLWADKLRRVGYDGRISLECSWGDDYPAELAQAMEIMKLFD